MFNGHDMHLRSPILLLALCLSLGATGCERVASHPALPPGAGDLVRKGGQEVQGLRGEVDRFVAGFAFRGAEAAAVGQLTQAMFSIFQIHDTGTALRSAVDIKRAQACLAIVGVESAGLMEYLQSLIFRDEKGRQWWEQFEAYMNSFDLPEFGGVVCDSRISQGTIDQRAEHG